MKTINELAIDLSSFRKKDKIFFKATIGEFELPAPCFVGYGNQYQIAIENAYNKYVSYNENREV